MNRGSEELLTDALRSLNQIGATINQVDQADRTNVRSILTLIVTSAMKVVPGASAVIYPSVFIPHAFESATLDIQARVFASPEESDAEIGDPRPNGMGMRALRQRRRVLSYEEQDLDIHPARVKAGVRTVACFPIFVAEQPLGVLYVYLHEPRPFTQLELLMLENFVNLAAMAIDQARQSQQAQRSLNRKEDELARLRRAGLLISSRLRLQDTLKAILEMAMDMTGARYGIFRLLDRSGQSLITTAMVGENLARPRVEALPVGTQSVMGWVAKHKVPARIYDLRQDPWRQIYYPLDAGLEMRSELAVPLIGASDRLEGVLNLESPQVGAFSEDDGHLLQALATQAVIAIQEARLLDTLQDVAERLLNQPGKEVLEQLVEQACNLLNASASAIWTLGSDKACLLLQAASAGFPCQASIPLHGTQVGEAVLSRSAVASDNLPGASHLSHPELAVDYKLARDFGWTGVVIVPLLVGDNNQPIGAFSIYTRRAAEKPSNSDWDEKVLTCLAHYATLAVQNTSRQMELRTAQEQHAVAETFAAVGDIAANLLHKLNNRVGTIPVRIQGIQDKRQAMLEADAYLASNLVEIERSAVEAMETVRENLSLLHPIHLVAVNVLNCVEKAISRTNLPVTINVNVQGIATLPSVRAGEHSLMLVLVNLLENAAEEMNGRGNITIQGKPSMQANKDCLVEITVSDSGPGIPKDLQERIFEFNYSGRAAARPHKLGFGLWWVKTVMTRLGGSVVVESDGVNGTTFHLYLPCMEGV